MSIKNAKSFFAKSLPRTGIHFAAHSHHPWPDATEAAHQQAWKDAARLRDEKWDAIFSETLPRARKNLATLMNLKKPEQIVEGANTFELVARLLSCFLNPKQPFQILTTDSEFYSFSRLILAWESVGFCKATRIPTVPFHTFEERLLKTAQTQNFDLLFMSHTFFNSGFIQTLNVSELVKLSQKMTVAIDGYHALGAVPVDLSKLEDHIFYLGGGYKYLMAGEGAGFMVVPKTFTRNPPITGWFAGFEDLESDHAGRPVHYPTHGQKFAGATFEPTAWYRLNAVFDFLKEQSWTVQTMHEHARGLQNYFLDGLQKDSFKGLKLIGFREFKDWGHFLTFQGRDAHNVKDALLKHNIYTDCRGDLLRIGFGCYHDKTDVDQLLKIIKD